ncbi:MAG: hypothetical protein AAF525_13855, partial [Pseudomonadota bacterium]
MSLCLSAHADSRDQAKRIHDRLAGVPPSATTLDTMADLIDDDRATEAAMMAMDHPDFYRTTLKNWAVPWTNRDFSVFAPLNDYVATVIGMVRDDVDFRELLYGDIIYVSQALPGIPAYSTSNNDHYEALEAQGVDLAANLERRAQGSVNGLPSEAISGVFTTRAGARAFFYLGTNRAMLRYTLVNHLCNDLEQLADTTRTPDRIRQDVTRSPGGDSRVFRNNCIGCHSGMDPLAQAFAYYDWDFNRDNDPTGENGQLTWNASGVTVEETGSRVVPKYHFNENNFPFGFVTPNDNWDNYWRAGVSQRMGWDEDLPGSGQGAASMGMELAHSDAFASCQVHKVFETVCLRTPGLRPRLGPLDRARRRRPGHRAGGRSQRVRLARFHPVDAND